MWLLCKKVLSKPHTNVFCYGPRNAGKSFSLDGAQLQQLAISFLCDQLVDPTNSLEGWKVVHSASPGKTQVVFVFLVILCILSVKPQSFCKLGEKSGQISWMTPNQYHEKMVFHHVHPIKSFLFWVSRVEFLTEENFVRKTHDLGWMVASLPRCLWTVWALIVNGVYLTTLQGCNNRWSTYPPKGIPPEIRPY